LGEKKLRSMFKGERDLKKKQDRARRKKGKSKGTEKLKKTKGGKGGGVENMNKPQKKSEKRGEGSRKKSSKEKKTPSSRLIRQYLRGVQKKREKGGKKVGKGREKLPGLKDPAASNSTIPRVQLLFGTGGHSGNRISQEGKRERLDKKRKRRRRGVGGGEKGGKERGKEKRDGTKGGEKSNESCANGDRRT